MDIIYLFESLFYFIIILIVVSVVVYNGFPINGKHLIRSVFRLEGETALNTVLNEAEYRTFRRKYPLPDFKSIFPTERSPFDNTSIVKEWVEWCRQLSVMPSDKFDKLSGTGIFAALFWPAADLKSFENLYKIMLFFFIIDDHTENEWGDMGRKEKKNIEIWSQLLSAIKKIMSDEYIPMNKWKPYVLAYYAVFENILLEFNHVQKKRFADCWIHYIEGNLEETERIEHGNRCNNIDEMLKLRIKSIGLKPCIQFIEYSDKLFVPEEDWDDIEMQTLIDLSCEVVSLHNDLYSFEKEVLQENGNLENSFNVVSFFVHREGLSIPEALEKCAKLTNVRETCLKELANKLRLNPKLSKATIKFLNRVEVAVGGNARGHVLCDRYWKYN